MDRLSFLIHSDKEAATIVQQSLKKDTSRRVDVGLDVDSSSLMDGVEPTQVIIAVETSNLSNNDINDPPLTPNTKRNQISAPPSTNSLSAAFFRSFNFDPLGINTNNASHIQNKSTNKHYRPRLD